MNWTSVSAQEQESTMDNGQQTDNARDQETAQEGDSGTPKVGMKFKNAEEAFSFYHKYAVCTGFGVKCQYSKYDKEGRCRCIVISCNRDGIVKYKTESHSSELTKKTNCMAKIHLGYRDDGYLHVKQLIVEHNHPLFPGKARDFRTKRKRKRYLYDNDKAEMPPRESWVGRRGREEIKCKLIHEKGDGEAIHRFFLRMQAKDSYFFHLMDWDDEGVLKNVFWADGRCRMAYQYFGDVVLVDSTCLIDKYDVPLVSFVGVNHHGQSVLLGCCLLSDESTETYTWMFKTWLSCMFAVGRPPSAIITDRCKAIQEAVAKVFPKTHYRQCLLHIMKRMGGNMQGLTEIEEIQTSFKKVVYESLRAEDFEEEWRKMIDKYGLESNEWFRSLYDDRHCWAPIFVKEKFWAGMSITVGCESMKSFFAEFMHSKFTVRQFLRKYEIIVQKKYKKEVQANTELLHKSPQLITQLYIEEQLGKVYTTDVFKHYQAEVRALVYCISSLINVNGPILTFNVKERVRVKDSKSMERRVYEVTFNEDELDVRCICHSFEYRGILCRHALSVICSQNIVEIPSKYILERWRKDYKRMHALSIFPDDIMVDGQLERHENFYRCCLKLSEIGLMSEEKYEFAVKVVDEAITKLLTDDGSCGLRHKDVSCEAATNSSLVTFTLSSDNYMGNGSDRAPNLLQVGQTVNVPHYEFFHDRDHTVQQSASYRSDTEWRLQFLQEAQIPEAAPRPW
ncbi:protein FAR1-RELATED SEQUENCE 6-like [Typha angustifolia]|uniref:protein FAR1-RELATED SEQUENCE 6-like n=1 Tax=Typha angustifolia TaxID=59011 RepID=UPI003C2EB7BC